MEPALTLIVSCAAALAAVLGLVLWKGRRREAETLEVVFELGLPSKWAAELTAQTLENEGISARVLPRGSTWKCSVTWPMGTDHGQLEPTCRKLNQIAEARGGGCVAHRMRLGGRREVFEHQQTLAAGLPLPQASPASGRAGGSFVEIIQSDVPISIDGV